MLNHSIQLEICTGGFADAIRAFSIDETDRIELNSALELGGLTPSMHSFLLTRNYTQKPILCMVRPRGAGFRYNEEETAVMFADAKAFLTSGADGIVFGFLKDDLTIDETRTSQMIDLIHSYGKTAVFHKAFDETPNPFQALETLITLGCDRILTSGQEPSCETGASMIHDLIEKADGRIEILPGGGVTATNIKEILQVSGANAIHMTAKSLMEDQSTYPAVDPAKIRQIVKLMEENNQPLRTLTKEDQSMLQNDAYDENILRYEDDGNRRD